MAIAKHPKPASSPAPALPVGKLDIVQALRALAVLLVVWTHSIVAAGYRSTPRQAAFFHLKSFGASGLDIFFVISGFIVSLVAMRGAEESSHSTRRFLSRRVTRIFPLYWLLTLIVIAEAQLGSHPILWHRVPWLPSLLLLPSWQYPVPPLILSLGWSLLFEVYFYLVLAAWMRATPRHPVRNTVFFLAGMVALGAAVGLHRPLLVIWSNPVALEFVFGCLIALLYKKSLRVMPLLGTSLAALGTLMLVATIFTGYGLASEASSIMAGLCGWLRLAVWGVPSALLVLGGILWNPAMRSFPSRLLVFIGDASYSIYLCTNPARSLVEHLWRYFGRWGGDVGVLLCGATCVGLGLACYLAVERPLMRFFHNWYKPVPFRAAANQPNG